MNEYMVIVKDIFTNMQAIGWAPWPAVICIAVMIFVRKYAEDDVVNVNTEVAKRQLGLMKLISLFVGYIVSLLSCYGFDTPKNKADIAQAIVFSFLNVVVGYMSWSVWSAVDPIGRIQARFFPKKENGNANPPAI
jgi:hypothetical protein